MGVLLVLVVVLVTGVKQSQLQVLQYMTVLYPKVLSPRSTLCRVLLDPGRLPETPYRVLVRPSGSLQRVNSVLFG